MPTHHTVRRIATNDRDCDVVVTEIHLDTPPAPVERPTRSLDGRADGHDTLPDTHKPTRATPDHETEQQ